MTDRHPSWLHDRHPRLRRCTLAAALLLLLGWCVLPWRFDRSDFDAVASAQLMLAGNAALASPSLVNEVTPQFLGNPFTDKPVLSRNVWDMQAFAGRIYFGHGDYGLNTGPIAIRYFNPSTMQFLVDSVLNTTNTECLQPDGSNYCVDEEEINNFRIIDDKLYIPGIDSREDFSFGNFYVKSAGDPAWVKYRTVPGGLHVFDLYPFSDPLGPAVPRKLFAGIGTTDTTTPMISLNGLGTAGSWSTSTLNGGPGATGRIYRLFELGGKLYGSSFVLDPGHILYRYEGGANFSQVPSADANRMFPDQVDGAGNTTVALRVFREVHIGNQMLYLGMTYERNPPYGLYKATDLTNAQKIVLPVPGVTPMAIKRGDDGLVYVLGRTGTAGAFTNYVFSSPDGNSWAEVLRFSTTAFARSFEYLDGYFYFGLGSPQSALSDATGNILRVYNPPPPPTATPTPTLSPTETASPTATSTAIPPSPAASATATSPPVVPTTATVPSPSTTTTPMVTAPSATLPPPTFTPAPTSTPTRTPTITPTPAPQPNVDVSVGSTGSGRLWATLAARPTGCIPNNQLLELRFGDDPRVYRNGAVEIDGQVRRPPFTVTLPPGTVSRTFSVIQLVAGTDVIVPVIAIDSCGQWSTFVGGGATTFQPLATAGSPASPATPPATTLSGAGGPSGPAPIQTTTPSVAPTTRQR